MNKLIVNVRNKLKNEVLLGSAFAFSIKIISAISAFLFNLSVANLLGVEQSGVFFLGLSVVTLVATISRFGIDNLVVRFVAGYSVKSDSVSISSFYFWSVKRVALCLVIFALMLVFFRGYFSIRVFKLPELEATIMYLGLSIVPLSLTQLNGFFFQGLKNTIFAMLFNTGALSVLVLLLTLIVKPSTPLEQSQVYLFSSVSIFLLSMFYWLKKINLSQGGASFQEVAEFYQAIKPLFVIVVLGQIIQWSGQILLGLLSSPSEVALFSAALRTAMLTSFVLISVNAIAAPKFAFHYKENDFHAIKETVKTSGRLILSTAIPLVVLMIFFAERIMLLFGRDFESASTLLIILAIGQFVNVATGSVGYLLQMTGNEKYLRNNMFISSGLMLILSPLAIMYHGALGAAVVTALALSTQNILGFIQVYRKLGINTLKVF